MSGEQRIGWTTGAHKGLVHAESPVLKGLWTRRPRQSLGLLVACAGGDSGAVHALAHDHNFHEWALHSMSTMLTVAAALTFGIGVLHSLLGERYIVGRFLRRDDLPKLFGDDVFSKQTIRFAWHLTSVAWWGLGAILIAVVLAPGDQGVRSITQVVAVTFLVSAVITAAATRFRHLAWVVFLAIAVVAAIG